MKKSSVITISIVGIIVALIIAIGFAMGMNDAAKNTNTEITPSPSTSIFEEQTNESTGGDRMMAIEDYVRINISDLAPEKEVLGGTYYVTSIEAHGGAGTVRYEDGHNAYTADFTYTTDENTGYTITSFKNR